MKKINWKKGSGAIIYGSCIMLSAVTLMLLTIERNNVYHNSVYSQTRTDLIADGAAEYGYNYFGINASDAHDMASRLNNYNNWLYDKDMTYTIDDSAMLYDHDVHVTTNTTMNMFFSDTEKTVTRDATTHVITDAPGVEINHNAFPEDPNMIVHPYVSSFPGFRNALTVNPIISQFKLMYNARYNSTNGDNSGSQILLWDFTVAMGCDIPIKNALGQTKTATEIADWMGSEEGKSSGWRAVTAQEAQNAANNGMPAVAIEYVSGRNGVAYIVKRDTGVYSDSIGPLIATGGNMRTDNAYLNQCTSAGNQILYFVHE